MSALATDLAAALDPVMFAEQAGLVPDAWQAQVLRSRAARLLLNCSRQVGKSTVTAVLALHTALYEAPALALLLSPSLRQSQELFAKVVTAYRRLGRPVPAEAENKLSLELDNGSRILALPGKEGTIRGYSGVQLVVLDEASRIADALYHAVRPMLAVSGGRLLLLSTPFGQRGVFFQEWIAGAGWERVEMRAQQCPRISPAFLVQERASLPAWIYRQEYECSFEAVADAVFAYADVQAALAADVEPLCFGETATA
jgi:hypothetical protein